MRSLDTYWHKHPRGLANECVMLRVCTPAQMRELSQMGYERLTAYQARRHIAWVNAEIDAAHGPPRASFGDARADMAAIDALFGNS